MYNFRNPQPTDQNQIIDLFHQLVSDPVQFNSFQDFDLSLLLEDTNCHCLVVEHQEKVIGFGALIIFRTPVFGWKGRIEDIIVDRNHRKKGLGKKLMQELITIGKNRGVKNIHLTSNPKREAARNLYLSLGFKPYDTGVFVLDLDENNQE